jgi:hypothetical protein
MTTAYRTKLFKSILDCGCTLGLGEFSEEAEFADVEKWLKERGYELTRVERSMVGDTPWDGASRKS